MEFVLTVATAGHKLNAPDVESSRSMRLGITTRFVSPSKSAIFSLPNKRKNSLALVLGHLRPRWWSAGPSNKYGAARGSRSVAPSVPRWNGLPCVHLSATRDVCVRQTHIDRSKAVMVADQV